MATGTTGTVARQLSTQQTHYLRKSVAYNTTGIASGVSMGWLPAGAQILRTGVNVTTVFNAATTNVLTVGTAADSGLDNIVAAGDVNEAAAAFTSVTTGAVVAITADTEIKVSYTQTGTAATTGAATIVLEYVPNNDG